MARAFLFEAEMECGNRLEGWHTEISADRAALLEADIGRTMKTAREAFLEAVARGLQTAEPGVILSFVLFDPNGDELQRVAVQASPDTTCVTVASTLDMLEPRVIDSMAAKVMGVH